VTVTTGKPVSARASGSSEALERVQLRVEGRTLLIRPNMSGWGGYPGRQPAPARIAVSTLDVTSVILLGSGSLDIDRMRGLKANVSAEGSGQLTVRTMDVDTLNLAISGSGGIEAAGKARQAAAFVRGAAEIRAADLVVSDLALTSETAGAVAMHATRSARVSAQGIGAVDIRGSAACEIRKQGAGPLSCGK
jgi:hypothetical protein